jgi:hypothetical protein
MKIRLVAALSVFSVCIGCRTSVPVKEVPVRTETRVVERLVPVSVPADSAVLSALLECDSANRVRLVEINELKSKNVKSDISLSTNAKGDAELNYSAKTVRDTVYIPAKDSIIYKDVPVYVTVEKPVNFLTGWQWVQVYLGRIFLIAVAAFAVFAAVKKHIARKK